MHLIATFEVHTDASRFAISGVLMQEGHPLPLKAKKLHDTRCGNDYCHTLPLNMQRGHYSLTSHFFILTRNIATSHIFTNSKETQPQASSVTRFISIIQLPTWVQKPGKINALNDVKSGRGRFLIFNFGK